MSATPLAPDGSRSTAPTPDRIAGHVQPAAALGALPVEPYPRDQAGLWGRAEALSIQEVLGLLSSASRSGLLWVTTPGERFLLNLHAGAVVYAQSDTPPAGSRLGELLVARGVLPKEAIHDLLAEASAAGLPFGSFLMRERCVAYPQLRAALGEQVQQMFNRMFSATAATWQFDTGRELDRSKDVRLNVVQLLLASSRACDGEGSSSALSTPVPLGCADG